MLKVDVRKQLRDFEQRVTFEVDRGEILLLRGRGGRGAFLHQLAGIPASESRQFRDVAGDEPIRPDEGTITLDDTVWFREPGGVCLTMAERGVFYGLVGRDNHLRVSEIPSVAQVLVLDVQSPRTEYWYDLWQRAKDTGCCIVAATNSVVAASLFADRACLLLRGRSCAADQLSQIRPAFATEVSTLAGNLLGDVKKGRAFAAEVSALAYNLMVEVAGMFADRERVLLHAPRGAGAGLEDKGKVFADLLTSLGAISGSVGGDIAKVGRVLDLFDSLVLNYRVALEGMGAGSGPKARDRALARLNKAVYALGQHIRRLELAMKGLEGYQRRRWGPRRARSSAIYQRKQETQGRPSKSKQRETPAESAGVKGEARDNCPVWDSSLPHCRQGRSFPPRQAPQGVRLGDNRLNLFSGKEGNRQDVWYNACGEKSWN